MSSVSDAWKGLSYGLVGPAESRKERVGGKCQRANGSRDGDSREGDVLRCRRRSPNPVDSDQPRSQTFAWASPWRVSSVSNSRAMLDTANQNDRPQVRRGRDRGQMSNNAPVDRRTC